MFGSIARARRATMAVSLAALSFATGCNGDRDATRDGGGGSPDGGGRGDAGSAMIDDPGELLVPQPECEALCLVLAERCGAPPGAADEVCADACSAGLTRSEVECFQSQDCAALEAFAFAGEPLCGIGDPACGDGVCQSSEDELGCADDCSTACEPRCGGAECGADGCGGSCGTCGSDEECEGGECVGTTIPGCTPACSGRDCGSDGCGGSCGSCDADEACRFGDCGLRCAADGSVGDCSGAGDIPCCNPAFSCDGGQGNRCCAFFGHACTSDADCCVVGMSGGVRLGCVTNEAGMRVCDAM